MLQRYRALGLASILLFYSLLYIATTKRVCEGDCEKMAEVSTALYTGRETYVRGVFRCVYNQVSDSICIFVKDTTGINWNLLADTACMIATQKGLPAQKIFILKNGSTAIDTLVKKQCP